jgi:cellulose synthase (UDP-forming)
VPFKSCSTGSCRCREALATNGGTTLIEHSEDVHTGFDLYRAGWALRYLPVPLAAGLCPSDPDSYLTQQYRWCAGSMSLLGSRKFWATRMRWRTRCCYLSGFCYYVHTALFTFAAPAIPLVMLIAEPERVRLVNYIFIVPSIIYNLVVFPAWHRCRYGPDALMAKLLYGWAHFFALWDICRRKRMGWQTTGGAKRKAGTRRIWVGVTVWNGGTGFAWVMLAVWRITRFGPVFVPLLATGLFACAISCLAIGARRNHARIIGGRP